MQILPEKTERRALLAFLALWLIWGGVLAGIRAVHPGLELGDGSNDADILHASNWFDAHGYAPTHFLPPRETATPRTHRLPPTYNTFPPGPFWVHEALKQLGLHELWQFRIAAVLLNQLAVLLIFLFVRRLSGSGVLAALTASIYMFSRAYASYSGGLWEHLPMLSLALTLWAWMGYEQAGTRRSRGAWFLLACLGNAIDADLTVLHSLMIAVFIVVRWGAAEAAKRKAESQKKNGLARLEGDPENRRPSFRSSLFALRSFLPVLVICSLPAFVLCARFLHQAIADGSFAAAVAYYRNSLFYRMGVDQPTVTRWGAYWIWFLRLGWPTFRDGSWRNPPDYFVLFPALVKGVLVSIALIVAALIAYLSTANSAARTIFLARLRPIRMCFATGLLLFAAASFWPMLMPEHTEMHLFLVIEPMLGLSMMLASIVLLGWQLRPASIVPGSAAPPSGPGVRPLRWAAPFAALSVLLVLLHDTRRADVLNRVVPLYPRMYAWTHDLGAKLDILARTGDTLRARGFHPRAVQIVPRVPILAYCIGMPFYELDHPNRLLAGDDEYTVIDLNVPKMHEFVGTLAEHEGPPSFTSASSTGRVAVFPGTTDFADPETRRRCVDKVTPAGLVIDEIRWAKAIDTQTDAASPCFASLVFRGRLTKEELQSTWVHLTVFGEQAMTDAPFERWSRLDQFVTRAPVGGVAWFEVPAEVAAVADRLTIELWSPAGVTPVELALRSAAQIPRPTASGDTRQPSAPAQPESASVP